ncbi:antibiotic biosynthesis monooxygenase [Herbiconiux sp. CPCC 205763]|uniref:Antibiotic biosynthesis monooxygenase n=1 Tax=Herbiconiux aconitum TaxID=2970913 RepID=A0ABT2GRJ2_9MICO|nr:antibiotic biosynthesis monooxygenase [Herbiconiux aconitum]MCS5718842.1 antibiotic biosynthesis monooxygenase [Herbiconiux aconitum]
MGEVRLRGFLVCASQYEARIVAEHLPDHIALTRAEPGCLSFEVTLTDDPLVWRVDELFRDETVFAAHQARAAGSSWGRATAGIERRYSVDGLSGEEGL